MVTKYDIFQVVYKNSIPIKPKEVVSKLGKDSQEYNNIRMILVKLVEDGLLTKTEFGFQAKLSQKTDLLFNIINYCVHNNVNYNMLLSRSLVSFVANALRKGEITSMNCNLTLKTLQKYVLILRKYSLLLLISKKPIRLKIFYNSLLKNLLLYFDFKLFIKYEKVNYIKEIETELRTFRTLRKKNEIGYQKVVETFEISFVHHSLALEGNPITLPDTFMIIKEKIIPKNVKLEDVDEVRNYQKAIHQMLYDSRRKGIMTFQSILGYHRVAMQHKPDMAGRIRIIDVHIRGNLHFKVAEVHEIESQLKGLLKKYHTFIRQKKNSIQKIIKFAAFFHNEFQHIHPFLDGNSRTTRLLTFYLLQAAGIPILDLPFGLLDEYLNYTKKSIQRVDMNLFEHLQKVILYNLKIINERIG
jgi:fido (protein-threonine AMPylation protein)